MHHLSKHPNVIRIHDTYEDTASVEACHWLGVMHRVLKPENFLFDAVEEGAKVKTTDFGLSVFYTPSLVALSLDLVFVEDAEGEGLVVDFGGGGDSDDVFEFSLAEELADVVDGVLGNGVGAEAKDHAGLDILDDLVGGNFLEVVLGEDDEGGGEGCWIKWPRNN
ncbi:Calcium-dependent protein kinase 11 [Glycine soja]|uniref:Calcium-dependent protein kinase 11 n=1 Tax=Glycine soja TaxID=3848 RepID=A0A0B2QFP1_GLYSO|nr:Calcium-dependent protein kinase 11 [Glycine soja]